MPASIRPYSPNDRQAWDSFVVAHPYGTPFHLTAWKQSVEETFGYESVYLVCEDGERLCGVLPLFYVDNLLMGKALISSPFAVYGGALCDSDVARKAFREYLAEFGREMGVRHLELRNAYPGQTLGFQGVARYVTFTQQLAPDEEQLLERIPRKTRYMVRKALKEDLSTRIQKSDYRAFEELYSRNLRKLGTPTFPARHFERLIENFGDAVDIREVLHRGRVVAAVMTFWFRDQALPYYGASDPAYNAIAPNNFMYFDLMRWAGRNGCSVFDFGRSKKSVSGSYDFKVHWGMQERDLPYEMLLVNRKTLPNYSPANPKYQFSIRLWRRLPLPVTRAIGPPLVRMLP
jgi:FemAB-related protein (PEP-CTERM system-associated)